MAPTLIVRSASPEDVYDGFKVDECWACPAPWEDDGLYWPHKKTGHASSYVRERFYFGFPAGVAAAQTLTARKNQFFTMNKVYVLLACGRRYITDRQAIFEHDTIVVCQEWTEHNGLPV